MCECAGTGHEERNEQEILYRIYRCVCHTNPCHVSLKVFEGHTKREGDQ